MYDLFGRIDWDSKPNGRNDIGKVILTNKKRPLPPAKNEIFCLFFRLSKTCRYAEYGCEFVLHESGILLHEKRCKYRLVNCVDLYCDSVVPLCDGIVHLKKKHSNVDFTENVALEPSSANGFIPTKEKHFAKNYSPIPDQLRCDGRHFFFECWRDDLLGFWSFWVYYLGGQEIANDYLYYLSIYNGNDESEYIKCTLRTVSVDIPRKRVPGGITISDSMVKRFMKNQSIEYRVSVKRSRD